MKKDNNKNAYRKNRNGFFKRGSEDAVCTHARHTGKQELKKKGEADMNLVIVYMFVWS